MSAIKAAPTSFGFPWGAGVFDASAAETSILKTGTKGVGSFAIMDAKALANRTIVDRRVKNKIVKPPVYPVAGAFVEHFAS